MAIFTKPAFNTVWAATGVKVAPSDVKISQGWIVEIPPYEYDNWAMNRLDAFAAHVNQAGIVSWDNTVEYQAGKSYVQSSLGTIYRALKTHTNANPDTDTMGNWEVAFERSGTALLKANNLADVPDKAQARLNLGISTTSDYDSRYNVKANNLADVPNKSSARNNLDIYSRQEVQDLIQNLQPAGQVVAFARQTPPTGWLVCDGSAVSRTTYARLFEALGTTFGAGNGSTTFNLPDLRGEFIRGIDAGRGVDVGRGFGTFQDSENKVHNHAVNDPGHSHNIRRTQNDGNFGVFDRVPGDTGTLWRSQTEESFTGITIAPAGGSESRPRNIALLYCIRT